MSTKVVCPGSFDPVTKGHEEYIRLAARLFDEVVVLVMQNCEKHGFFTAQERYELARLAFEDAPNIRVELFEGFLGAYCKENHIDAIVKGIRGVEDCGYETMLANINRHVGDCETVLLPARGESSYISSTFVRELLRYGRDFAPYVPEKSLLYLKKTYRNS